MADDLIERLEFLCSDAAARLLTAGGRMEQFVEFGTRAIAALRAQPTSPSDKVSHAATYLANMIVEWDAGSARNGPLPASIIEKSLTRFFGQPTSPSGVPSDAAVVARALLAERDRFIVERDLWADFVAWLPRISFAPRPLPSKQDAGSGEAEPAAYVVRLKYSEDHWSGDMLTDILPTDDGSYVVVRPLYAAPTADPRVKSLQWRERVVNRATPDNENVKFILDTDGLRNFAPQIEGYIEGTERFYLWCDGAGTWFDTVEEAKASAQAAYERQIRAALEALP